MWFKAYHLFGHGKSMDASNYLAEFNSENCNGCGLCEKRCPMEIVTLEASEKANNKKGKIAVLKGGSCIGCGVCAYKCPTESIELTIREEITKPPESVRDFSMKFVNDLSDPLPRR